MMFYGMALSPVFSNPHVVRCGIVEANSSGLSDFHHCVVTKLICFSQELHSSSLLFWPDAYFFEEP